MIFIMIVNYLAKLPILSVILFSGHPEDSVKTIDLLHNIQRENANQAAMDIQLKLKNE